MTTSTPWRDREQLAALLGCWWRDVGERAVHRVVVGPGWLRLNLEGDDHPAILCSLLPGAVLTCPLAGRLPAPLHRALTPTRGDPLPELLRDARLLGVALLRDDLVVQWRLATPAGERRLRHQLFGSRGGLVVLDADHRMLYTAFPGPHPCLIEPAPALAEPPAVLADDVALDQWSRLGLTRVVRQREVALSEALTRAAGRAEEAAMRLVQNLQADLDKADDGDDRRRDAETLATHLHTITRGQEQAVLDDPATGEARSIALDPALAPHANLERLFKLARKAARGRDVVAGRLEDARREQGVAGRLAAELRSLVATGTGGLDEDLDAALERLAALQDFQARYPERFSERRTTGVQAPDEPTRPFRRYRIDDRWDVWVGRSSEENDQLTHRASHPRDLWLHAQGVPGSHVILRTDGHPDQVPRHVLERAAALAALHSKARNSALVPVVYTERRYVRKPRKAPPGTAVCLQEKNLFAEPGVARGVEPG